MIKWISFLRYMFVLFFLLLCINSTPISPNNSSTQADTPLSYRTMQRNRPGPAQFKAAFAGGPAQDITVRPRSRPATTLRPINHPPGWLETVLMRPIRVECWSCLRPSWLHRGQRDATPHDWTCLNCLTHQRRDKVLFGNKKLLEK